jgi:hypothetical protein
MPAIELRSRQGSIDLPSSYIVDDAEYLTLRNKMVLLMFACVMLGFVTPGPQSRRGKSHSALATAGKGAAREEPARCVQVAAVIAANATNARPLLNCMIRYPWSVLKAAYLAISTHVTVHMRLSRYRKTRPIRTPHW